MAPPTPASDTRLGVDVAVEGGRTALDNKTSLLNTPSPRSFAGPRGREFSPYGYGESICTYDKSALKEAVFDDDVEQFRDCESACRLCFSVRGKRKKREGKKNTVDIFLFCAPPHAPCWQEA